MDMEYTSQIERNTWDLVSHPLDVKVFLFWWAFILKYNRNNTINNGKTLW